MKRNKIKIALLGLTYFFCQLTWTQELIQNGNLEKYKPGRETVTPKSFQDLVGEWDAFSNTNVNRNKPCVLNRPKNATCKPGNLISLYYSNFDESEGREYKIKIFQIPLLESLEKDSIYRFSLNIDFLFLEDKDAIMDNKAVQFYLSDFKFKNLDDLKRIDFNKLIAILPSGISIHNYSLHNDSLQCDTFVSIDFKAQGIEKYLLIGTFKPIYLKYSCAVIMDDLSLTSVSSLSYNISNTAPGSGFIMDNILFDTNKSILKKSSFKELNILLQELKKNPKLKLEISGHTDDTGTDEHNNQLSEQRAKAVLDYLVQHGIEKERLSYKGYGSIKPIADNGTEKGRSKNRRVEVKILDK